MREGNRQERFVILPQGLAGFIRKKLPKNGDKFTIPNKIRSETSTQLHSGAEKGKIPPQRKAWATTQTYQSRITPISHGYSR